MRIHTLISWYNESPTWLAATIGSVSKFSDSVIAVDGAYELFPSGPFLGESSGSEQHEAIVKQCEALGMAVTLHVPTHPWKGNEVAKRTQMFRLAEAVAEPEVDWYFVMDADEVVLEWPENFPGVLEETEYDVGSVVATDVLWRPSGTYDHNQGEAILQFLEVRKFYRAMPGIHVDGMHHHYKVQRNGHMLYLWGSADLPLEPMLSTGMLIEHRNHLRSGRRKTAAAAYYQERDRLGIESATPIEVSKLRRRTA